MASTSKGDRLEGRRIINTSATSGIGAATARLFARHGARLVLMDHHKERLASVATDTGGPPMVVNVTDGSAVNSAVTKGQRMGAVSMGRSTLPALSCRARSRRLPMTSGIVC
jgi:NADP-dependent 3-hydroxy acid dehydrogenase YdfG